MRILIIGEPCIDVIHKADGKVYHEPGGISYSITASGILDDEIETLPIIGMCPEDRSYFDEILLRLRSVNLSGLYEVESPVRRVDLFYEDDNARWECSTQPIEPTPYDKIEPFLKDADGIHLNLIGGDDVELETLARMRNAAPGTHIHLDLHNIVMQRLPDGKRLRRPRADYLQWSGYADTVQLNEEEASVIDPETKDHRKLAEKILAAGPKAVVISYAERGLSLYEKVGGKIVEHTFPPVNTTVVDPTGSGDVFGATFLHAILLGKNFTEAAKAGVEMAVKKVGVAGPGGLLKIRTKGENV